MTGLPEADSLTLSDGHKIGFRSYETLTAGSHSLVLIHGSAGFGAQLHPMASAVAKRGLAKVYTVDLRGHGLSAGPPGHAVRHPEQLCEDIAEFIGFVKRRSPLDAITLGGHSAGGGLILRFSRSAAHKGVSSYLFFAPYLGLGSPTIRPLFGGWVKVRANLLRALAIANVLGISQFNETTVVAFDLTGCLGNPSYTPSWSFNTLLAFGPGRWAPDTDRISADCPTLVVSGQNDECFFAETYGEAFRTIGTHAEIRTVANCGHWDVLVHPDALAIILDWLERIRRQGLTAQRLQA
jgi:pimeloyl-ACP methyl ester carboxylesterase